MPGTRPTAARRRERQEASAAAQRAARERREDQRRELDPDGALAAFRAAVDRLTGRQRHLWARAGYPGLRSRDPVPLRPFAGNAPTEAA